MKAAVVITLLAALALGAGSVASADSGSRPEAQRCPVPGDLAAHDGEKRPQKGNRQFDRREPERELAASKPVAPPLRGAIRRVDLPKGSRKLIALTLDLCEQTGEIAGYDGAVFDYLRRERVRATLFAGGKWMRSHEARTRQLMTDPLFEIGNHGWAHRNLRLLSGKAMTDEILGPQRVYEAIRAGLAERQCLTPDAVHAIAPRIALFRFPFGACHPASLDAVNDAGLLAVQWDLSTGDPSPTQSARAIADAMVRGARPGSIIIAHANGRGFNTAAALPIAIPKLKSMGFEFVTVGELLAAGRPVVVPTCYDSRPGDIDRYDTLFALKPRAAAGAAPAAPGQQQ